MEENRRNLRRHINAARDWLLQAEKSIERKDDVRGDLKLMLAKAELQNAEKHRSQKVRHIAAFVAAAMIAAGYFFINSLNNELPPPQLSSSSTNVPDPPEIEKPLLSSESFAEPLNNEPQAESDFSAGANISNESYEIDTLPNAAENQYEENYPEAVENAADEEISRYNEVVEVPVPVQQVPEEMTPNSFMQEAAIPSEDMQKLMQSAGEILRAK